MFNVLVIGYGNPLRGDDGVGQVVARAILEWQVPNVKVLTLHQLTPELADDLAQIDTVYFVDACMDTTLEHPRVREISSNYTARSASHYSSPRDLITVAKRLYGCTARAYTIEVPAESFELSEGLSVKAQKGVREVLEYLREAVNGTENIKQISVSEKLLRHL
jgi:hydrogenase maturation protease